MSDFSQGPGWWQASDLKWYPPQSEPAPTPAPAPAWGAPQAQPYAQPYASNYQVYGQGGPGPSLPSVQGFAVASMVLGIVSLPLVLCWILSVICSLVGLPMGLVALSKIKKGQAQSGPKGMAIAGVVCCTISLVMCAALVIFVLVDGGSSYSYDGY